MKNRKLFPVLLALLLGMILLLAAFLMKGLGTGLENGKVLKIGVCFRQLSDTETTTYWECLENMLHYSGYETEVADGKNDQTKQDAQILQLISNGCDLLIVEPVMITAADTVASRLKEAGIPVVFINRKPEEKVLQSWDRILYVGCDTADPGKVQGQIVLGLPDGGDVNGDGVISCVILQADPDLIDTQQRTEHCVREITEAGRKVTCLETISTDGTAESSKLYCQQLLARYGMDIEVIFCNTDVIALGAAAAVEDGGWIPGKDVYLLGIGAENRALQLVQQGVLSGTVKKDIPSLCNQTLDAAQSLLTGAAAEKITYVEHIPVTKDNVAEYIPAA